MWRSGGIRDQLICKQVGLSSKLEADAGSEAMVGWTGYCRPTIQC